MDSRERIYKVIKKREPADAVPWTFNFGATQGFNPDLLKRYKKHKKIDIPVAEYFDYDIYPVLDPDGDESKVGLAELVSGIDFVSNN